MKVCQIVIFNKWSMIQMLKFKIEQLKVEIGDTILSAVLVTVRNFTLQNIYLYINAILFNMQYIIEKVNILCLDP